MPRRFTSVPRAGSTCETLLMTIDIKAMLDQVVGKVFDEICAVTAVSSRNAAWLHGVRVSCSVAAV